MKKFIIKHQNKIVIALLVITIILQVLLRIDYGSEKSYLHMDESYSYGLMNYDKINITDDEDFYNKWHTAAYFEDYLSISKEEANDLTPVYENQKNDVHPPLFYFLLRIAASFTIGTFSKWTGIILNIFIFILSSIIIYFIAKRLFKNKIYALLVVLINGFTLASIDTTLYIRMYALNALNILIITYLHIIYYEKQELQLKDLAIMSVFIILGSITHYYYLVFLFMLYVLYMIKFIKWKNFKNALKYTGMMIISAAISLCIFPYSFVHMFMGYRGQETLSNLEEIENMWNSLGKYIGLLNNEVFNGILVVIFIIIAIIAFIKIWKNKKITIYFENKIFLLLFLPTVIYFMIIGLTSPYQETRYIMPICPLLVICVIYLTQICLQKVFSSKVSFTIITCLFIIMMFLPKILNISLLYYYDDYKEIVQTIEDKHTLPTLYIFNKNQNRFLDDLYMFTKIDNSYILDAELYSKEKISEIFSGKDTSNGIIVFINEGHELNNEIYLDEITEELKGTSYKHLRRMNACDIYIVEKNK